MESGATPNPENPHPPQEPGPARRLTRSGTDRVLGGVCGGLARYLRVDPLLVRVVAVALVFVGGAGAIAYLGMLLLVPEEQPGSIDDTAVLNRQLTAGAVVLIVVALIFGGPFILGGGLVALGIALPLAFAALLGAVAWWLVSGEPLGGGPADIARRSLLGLLVLVGCLLMVVAGFLGTGLGGGVATGAAVIAAGVVLVVGAFAGKVRWVALPAVALALGAALAAASNVSLQGGAGDRDYRPTANLQNRYELGAGRLVVDLRGMALNRGDTHLRMRVGMGQAAVIVPDDVCVVTRADLGAGGIDVFGRANGGFDYSFVDEPEAPKRGKRLVLDADVGFGELVVAHDRRFMNERGPRPLDHDSLRAEPGNVGCARA